MRGKYIDHVPKAGYAPASLVNQMTLLEVGAYRLEIISVPQVEWHL